MRLRIPHASADRWQLSLAISAILSSSHLQASTPSEMAEMSLQDLFLYSVDEDAGGAFSGSPWRLDFAYKRQNFEGYQSGTEKLSNADVLFSPGETRTDENYPILPTVISQEALIAQISYQLDQDRSLTFGLPYLEQSTDHISEVPGYDTFTIDSRGVGDVYLQYSQIVQRGSDHQWSVMLGVSAPTGSIDEKGDTPRGPGNQQLPYTMQLGSGTWDVPFALSYQYSGAQTLWGVNLGGKIRLGENDRDYRLGNRYAIAGWGKRCLDIGVCPTARLSYQHWGDIEGGDETLLVPAAFPYPANITDPDNYGGDKLNLAVGMEIPFGEHALVMEVSAPLYQDLNGVQNRERFNFSLGWNFAL